MKFHTHAKLKISLMGVSILCLLLGPALLFDKGSPLYFTENESDQHKETLSQTGPFVDQGLLDLLQEPENHNLLVSVIISGYPETFQRIRGTLPLSTEILNQYDDFLCFEAKLPLSAIIELRENLLIKGIYSNNARKVTMIENLASITKTRSNPEAASDEIQSAYNVTEFLDREGLADALGINVTGTYGDNTVIAVLDSGIDASTQDVNIFEGANLDLTAVLVNYEQDFLQVVTENQSVNLNILADESFVPYDPIPYMDVTGTGTAHAGIASGVGINNVSYMGIAPNASVINVKVLDSIGFTYYSFILSGLKWSLTHDADVVLVPWSFPGQNDDPICNAVDLLVAKGLTVVVAAGEDGPAYTSLFSPAQAKTALRVGAYDPFTDTVANFSSRGPTFDMRQGIDIISPGVNITAPVSSMLGKAENLTLMSSTGVAAAIVAGACAILISLFPSVTPEMLIVALTKTAHSILPGRDPNSEGFGLFNITAAALFLKQYIETPDYFSNRAPSDSLYPGFIINADIYEMAGLEVPRLYDDDQYSVIGVTGSQALLLAFSLLNRSQMEDNSTTIPDLHLPMASFGFSYNDTAVNFAECEVAKEMDMITKFFDASLYTRYTSVLNYDQNLYISVMIEAWSYTFKIDEGDNETLTLPETFPNFTLEDLVNSSYDIPDLGFNYTGRVPSFKISFGFINIGDRIYENLSVQSLFKADLYLNEKGLNNLNDVQVSEVLNAGNDDFIDYDPVSQMMTVKDQYNEGDNATGEWTMMGYNSTSHRLSGWEINTTDSMFSSLFSGSILKLSNASAPGKDDGIEDYGFFQTWKLTDSLGPYSTEKFESILGIGKSTSESGAYESMMHGFDRLLNNITIPEINDLAVVTADLPRMNGLHENYHSEIKIINLGNTVQYGTDLYFVVNYTSGENEGEIITKVFEIDEIHPLQILSYSADWVPTQTGVFTIGWRIAGISEIWTDTDDVSSNDFLSRVCVIYDYEHLRPHLSDLLVVTPSKFPLEPFVVSYTGDTAMANLTVLSPVPLGAVEFVFSGLHTTVVTISNYTVSTEKTFLQVGLDITVPMAYRPSPYLLNLHVSTHNAQAEFILPIQFQLKENLGRIMFDGIHNQIFPDFELEGGGGLDDLNMDLDGNSLSSGFSLNDLLSERLETLFGNYYSFHSALSDNLFSDAKGFAMMQIIKGLDLAGMFEGFDVNSAEMGDSLIMDQIFNGDNFFTFSEGEFVTDFYHYDLIKYMDAVVFANPEVNFSTSELDALSRYLELGGTLFIFTENNSDSDIGVLNQLLSLGNLTLGEQYNGILTVNNFSSWSTVLSKGLSSVELYNPLSIINTTDSANVSYLIDDYLAISTVGLGKMVVVGDTEMIQENNIVKGDQMRFIYNLFEYEMDVRFEWESHLTSSSINYGESTYVEISLQNTEMSSLMIEDFLAIVSCVDSSGADIQAQMFGYDTPILPLIKTNDSAAIAEISSLWVESPGEGQTSEIWISVIIDSPQAMTETISFKLSILGEEEDTGWSKYQMPPREFSNGFEIAFAAIILLSIVAFWRYSYIRWRLRQRYVTVSSTAQNEVKTRLSTLQSSIHQVSIGIENTQFNEIEKIRYILGEEARLKKSLRDIHELAQDLGEE